MVAEIEVLLHVDDVVQVVLVFPLYHIQDLQLNQSLVMKPTDPTVTQDEYLKVTKALNKRYSHKLHLGRDWTQGSAVCAAAADSVV